MTGRTFISCGKCDEHITLPDVVDLELFGDLVAAHGLTHGTDWRPLADHIVAVAKAQQAHLEARAEGIPEPW